MENQEFSDRFHELHMQIRDMRRARDQESESSNGVTDEDHRQIATKLNNLSILKRLKFDFRFFKARIKIREVEAFKHTLLVDLDSSKSSEVFQGFNNVDFHKNLYKHMEPWKDKVIKERGSGTKMTLLDSASMANRFDEEDRLGFSLLKETVLIKLGSELSKVIVSYLMIFLAWEKEGKEMRGRANILKETIRCESLDEEEGIFITTRLVSSINFFEEIGIMDKKGKSVDDVDYDQRDHLFFVSIFNMVHFLVIVSSCPFFTVVLDNEDLLEFTDFLIACYVEKTKGIEIMIRNDLNDLMDCDSSYIDEIMSKRNILMNLVGLKNMELWK